MTTKEMIVETASKLFQENGYENTSIQQIIEACGISKGGFYHHFSSKESVFVALSEVTFAPLVSDIADVFADVQFSLKEKILKILQKKAEFYLHRFELIKPIFSDERHATLQFKGKLVVKRLLKPFLEEAISQCDKRKPHQKEMITLVFGIHEMLFEYIIPDVQNPEELHVYFELLSKTTEKLFQ